MDKGPLLAMIGGRNQSRRQLEFRRYMEHAIAMLFGVVTGKAVGIQQEKMRRGIHEDQPLAKLISVIDGEIEKKKSE